MVAPSDMMDGRVSALRDALDQAGHQVQGNLVFSLLLVHQFEYWRWNS